MQWVVLADENQRKELLSEGVSGNIDLVWIKQLKDFPEYRIADGFVDLLFTNDEERIELLKTFLPRSVIVHSVAVTLDEMKVPFIRINAWPGFLERRIIEASSKDDRQKQDAEQFFLQLNKKIEWLPDMPGFVTARIISMIINEAWFAYGENLSTKQEMDAAMKLGLNYPYGPFEWCARIGTKNIYDLLIALTALNSSYAPAPLLEKEKNGSTDPEY